MLDRLMPFASTIRFALFAAVLTCGQCLRAQSWPELESSNFTVSTALLRVDTDTDGLPDAWEISNGSDPLTKDATANPDGDYRTNIEEYNAGSDPRVFDSPDPSSGVSGLFAISLRTTAPDKDKDGLPDAWELVYGFDPDTDSTTGNPDRDGFTNLQEYNGGWNPLLAEDPASQSGVSPIFTANAGAYPLGYLTDSDTDGMPDWWEARYNLSITEKDATGNPDGDELNNLEEYQAGRLPNKDDRFGEDVEASAMFALDTIGLSPDTDKDGMPDWWEILHGLDPSTPDANGDPDRDDRWNIDEYNAGTNPRVDDWAGPDRLASPLSVVNTGAYEGGYSSDSDTDGMPDWWESKYGLNITVKDAIENPDQDGLTNVEEYKAGTNPKLFDFVFFADAQSGLFILDTGGWWTDTDGDKLPDWWERSYGGNIRSMLAGVDLDGDGQSNLKEFAAGMNPLDAQSSFRVTRYWMQQGPNGPEMAVQWQSQPRRIYRIFVTEDLSAWPAEPAAEVAGDGSVKAYAYAIEGDAKAFMRIEVVVIGQ